MNTRRQLAAAAAVMTFAPWIGAAQPYPNRPIRLIYNFAPGGPGDAVARYLALHMGTVLGQHIIVENVSGANGAIGIITTARSKNDGYTILLAALPGVVLIPLQIQESKFDPFKSLTPIAIAGTAPLVIVAHPDVPANDFPGFVEWARKEPHGVDVAGAGAIVQIATAILARDGKLNLVWVPYRGMAPAIQAVIGGEVKVAFVGPSPMLSEFVKSGRLKAIGVTSKETSAFFPEVAPVGNYIPKFSQEIDFTLWGPPGLPPEVVSRIDKALVQVLGETGTSKTMQTNGMLAQYINPAEVLKIVHRENDKIRKVLETTPMNFGAN